MNSHTRKGVKARHSYIERRRCDRPTLFQEITAAPSSLRHSFLVLLTTP